MNTEKKVSRRTYFRGSLLERTSTISYAELANFVEEQMEVDLIYTFARWLEWLFPGIKLPPELIKGRRKTCAQHEYVQLRSRIKFQINEIFVDTDKLCRLFILPNARIVLRKGASLVKPFRFEIAKKGIGLADRLGERLISMKLSGGLTPMEVKDISKDITNHKLFADNVIGAIITNKLLSKQEKKDQLDRLGYEI